MVGRVIAVVVAVVIAQGIAGADMQVWTATGTVRFLREAKKPPGAGVAVQVSAARNEWEGFQILLRSDDPINGFTIVAADLAGPGGAVIKASEARIYRQHLMDLATPSHRVETTTGWYPDGLIPAIHPLTGKPLVGRLKAMPFDLPGGQTHGFFIDVYVPTDARPGVYSGDYELRTTNGVVVVKIPVALKVHGFALPETMSLKTIFGSPAARMRGYYRDRAKAKKEEEPAEWEAVDEQCARCLRDHRMNVYPPATMLMPLLTASGGYAFDDEQVKALAAFIERWHPNALEVARPQHIVKDPEKERANLLAYLGAFDDLARRLNRPEVTFYTYLKDEPNDEAAYEEVRKWGKAVRAAKSVVKVMVVEQPQTQNAAWGDLHGAVDIWCPLFPLYEEEPARQRQALGEKIWTYTALCQRNPTPWWQLDCPLLNYRVPAWTAWRYDMEGLLYWGGMTFWKQVEDPWSDPRTLDRRKDGKGPLYNGEGVLVYPGRAVGYEGIAPTLRLKALRDSVEDCEYFALAAKAGKRAAALKIVQGLAPSWFEWNKEPEAYQRAREEIAELIGGR